MAVSNSRANAAFSKIRPSNFPQTQVCLEEPEMETAALYSDQNGPSAAAHAQNVIDRGSTVRMPELFDGAHPDLLYFLADRNGVSVAALRTSSLTDDQVVKILTYRLAQYLAAGYVDARTAFEREMQHEPLWQLHRDDVHIIVGSQKAGQVLCYLVIRASDVPMGATLRTYRGSSLPVVDLCGHGVFNRLRILPDLPLRRVREIGRFAKNRQLNALEHVVARAPVETGVALYRLLAGPLRLELDACVGDLDDGVVKKYLEYFHVPLAVLHGVVPQVASDSYLLPRYETSNAYPFAFTSSDLFTAATRIDDIEQMLEAPGLGGLRRLVADRAKPETSSLHPHHGLPSLTKVSLPQSEVSMNVRREILALGAWLRDIEPFGSLSIAEAAILATLLERQTVEAGSVVVRQGVATDGLYLIASGTAYEQVRASTGERLALNQLKVGDYFGELDLLTGETPTADVIAIERMDVLRLNRQSYKKYLADLADVELALTRVALRRAHRDLHSRLMAEIQRPVRERIPPVASRLQQELI
jgi:CRP-like cAMP-binding protein